MQCKNCGQETNGIKINEKLFCTNCGEALDIIKVETQTINQTKEQPKAKIIPKDEESPELKEEEFELNILEAENLALDLILKETLLEQKKITPKNKKSKIKTKEKIKNYPIVKHERIRTDKIHGFDLLKNQPNPIDEPELPIPHDDMIEESKVTLATPENEVNINFANTKESQRLSLLTNESKENINIKQIQKASALKGFFTKGLVESAKNKSSKPKNSHRAIYITLIIFFTFIIGFVSLVLYVNFYAIDSERAIKKAEENVSFEYTKPSYLPPGYEVNYKTKASSNKITYVYGYLPNKNQTITITIEKSDISKEMIFNNFVLKSNMEYTEKIYNEVTYWLMGDSTAIFNDKALYQIYSSGTISTEEIIKIVEGII